MLFNSIDFALFLPLVFLLYWGVFQRSVKARNGFLLVVSYVFYGWWDGRFLLLIAFSTLVDYWVGLKLRDQERERVRKALLYLSLGVNLGLLGFFKYYNFFVDSFVDAFRFFGHEIPARGLDIVLPVGISFYTFQTLSYSIDIYRRKLSPAPDFVAFAAFVTYFPQLVAGPIERATNLLPQFSHLARFDRSKAADGLRQMLWGFFKKMVVADHCAEHVNLIFSDPSAHSGGTLWLGALFFAFQIYGDFSGYSDIAIGSSRLFGFDLMRNFAFPYFSRDIAEFWRRWHISLSTWFRDYLYIPLGGSQGGLGVKVRNTFIIFIVSGFWHGANWTFVFWGFLNALYFLPLLLLGANRNHLEIVAKDRWFPNLRELLSIGITFALTLLAWVFFRAADVAQAFAYVGGMFRWEHFAQLTYVNWIGTALTLFWIGYLLSMEWMARDRQHALEGFWARRPRILRWSFYAVQIFIIGMFHQTGETPFIYFQF
ncbi:MBOAT family protein [bacterium]|nr:MBOAT family protein [bacterium]